MNTAGKFAFGILIALVLLLGYFAFFLNSSGKTTGSTVTSSKTPILFFDPGVNAVRGELSLRVDSISGTDTISRYYISTLVRAKDSSKHIYQDSFALMQLKDSFLLQDFHKHY